MRRRRKLSEKERREKKAEEVKEMLIKIQNDPIARAQARKLVEECYR